MKRFSFFLAVFSIGLVLFLLVTGQFGTMFSGESASTKDSIDVIPEAPASDTPNSNTFSTSIYDYDRGRIRATVRGEIEGANLLTVDGGIGDQRVLANAGVEIPLYGPDPDAPPEDAFQLQAELVTYEPGDDTSVDQVKLDGKIHGEGLANGFPAFDTRDVIMTFDAEGTAHLAGAQRVQLGYPAVTLRGQKGFEANIDGSDGLSDITLQPPLIAALRSDSTGSILGFSGAALLENRDGVEEKSRVHLFSLGPMHIDSDASAAVFEGPVYIYQVPADTSLDPPRLEDLPLHHFRCEKLTLELDAKSRGITRLIAERIDEPVKVFLADRYRVEGDKLIWSEGDREADLSGNVRIFGEIGEVTAGGAKIRPDEGICHLIGGLVANIRGDALAKRGGGDGEGEWEQRLGGAWTLEAHHAELHYSRKSKGQELELFRALAAPEERVTIREDREGGALLLGGEMVYTPESGTIRILAGDRTDALRPDFQDGRNRVRAGRIDLSLISPVLEFADHVNASIFEPPAGIDGKWPEWLAPVGGSLDEAVITLEAERVRLSSSADHRLQRIEAWGADDEPLELTQRSEERIRFLADAIDWDGPAELIRAFGDGTQRMVIENRADLTAHELSFSTATWIARGDGEVHCVAIRPAPSRAEGPAPRPVTVDGDRLEVTLRPPPVEGTAAETAIADTLDGRKPRTGDVLGARGWSDTPGTLEVEEGTFRLIGDELVWDAVEGLIRMQGRGRQRVIYRGPGGEDELSASSLIYTSADHQLVLEGETRGRIHQGSVSTEVESAESRLPWNVTAGSLVAHFRTVGDDERIVLDRVIAGEKVVLVQPESEIEFRGDTAEWDAVTERLRIYSPTGQGLQTLYRGTKRRDELIAREIVMVRPTPLVPGRLDRLEALFIDVLSATIHLAEAPADDPKNPDQFTMRADNLIVGFSGLREERGNPSSGDRSTTGGFGGGGLGMPIDEARAWGNVDFRGGAYHVVCHRSMFRRATRTLYFEGQGRSKVQVLAQERQTFPAANRMSVEWIPDRGFVFRSVPSGRSWSSSQIEETLELFGRSDRGEE